MRIQNIYNCIKFTPNDNLNLTCDNKTRCIILRGEQCYDYYTYIDVVTDPNDTVLEDIYRKDKS